MGDQERAGEEEHNLFGGPMPTGGEQEGELLEQEIFMMNQDELQTARLELFVLVSEKKNLLPPRVTRKHSFDHYPRRSSSWYHCATTLLWSPSRHCASTIYPTTAAAVESIGDRRLQRPTRENGNP